MYLFYKICKVLDRKWKKVFGIAKNVYLNEITAFLIGHETAHACFKADAKYKDTVTKKIKEFLVDTNAPKNLRERYALSLVPESITEKEIEEFACDYIGLKHLFKSYASLHDYSSEQIKELIGQLLCIVTMQMYPSNIDTLYSFKLSKNGLSLHAHKHVASVYRLGLAAYFIQDTLIDEYDFDYSSFLDDQIKLSKTLLDGIWTVDVSSLLTIMNMVKMNEPPELEDMDRVIEHFKIFSDIFSAVFPVIGIAVFFQKFDDPFNDLFSRKTHIFRAKGNILINRFFKQLIFRILEYQTYPESGGTGGLLVFPDAFPF